MTAIAMTMTATAATTGTIRLTLVKKYFKVSSSWWSPFISFSEESLPSPGIPLAGAIVPITENNKSVFDH